MVFIEVLKILWILITKLTKIQLLLFLKLKENLFYFHTEYNNYE